MPGDTNAEKNGFGLSYRTNAKTKIGSLELRKQRMLHFIPRDSRKFRCKTTGTGKQPWERNG